MIRIFRTDDILEIFRIEQQNPDTRIFTKKELKELMDSPTVQCYVAEEGIRVVGYLLYTWTQKYYQIITVKMLPEYRRKKYGSLLIEKIRDRLVPVGRNRIVLYVEQTNIDACLFFKRLGFRSFAVEEDYIVFKYCMAFDYIGARNVE